MLVNSRSLHGAWLYVRLRNMQFGIVCGLDFNELGTL